MSLYSALLFAVLWVYNLLQIFNPHHAAELKGKLSKAERHSYIIDRRIQNFYHKLLEAEEALGRRRYAITDTIEHVREAYFDHFHPEEADQISIASRFPPETPYQPSEHIQRIRERRLAQEATHRSEASRIFHEKFDHILVARTGVLDELPTFEEAFPELQYPE